MLLNRKYINDLMKENESLKKDLGSKENTIINLLDANKELSQSNNYYENQNRLLQQEYSELLKENARLKGKLDKVRNYCKQVTGVDILEGDE